jgi:DNA-binding transcriptional ArsR family regulator
MNPYMEPVCHLEKIFGRTAQMIVLEYLLDNKDNDTYLSGIAAETGLSHSTVSRVIEPLLDIEIIKEKPLGKQIRVFRLNQESELTKYLLKFNYELKHMMNNGGGKP